MIGNASEQFSSFARWPVRLRCSCGLEPSISTLRVFGPRRQISSLSTTVADLYYVLHTFQKKSKTGSKTPKQELDLVKERLKRAEEHYREWTEKHQKGTP
ncbi:MAG: type II toxin-antitoxin system RelE/ParE family toxin [Verrucomicrobia bacterium]|nr:type II toxin-antitoxin system RelE/ParE family toxin [Verrucomicrobiota bacterium]